MDYLINQNIANLCALWQSVGEAFGVYSSNKYFDSVLLNYSDWPNRLWFHQQASEESVLPAKEVIRAHEKKVIIPYWNIYDERSYSFLESQGFEPVFQQIGMYLQLQEKFSVEHSLSIKKVKNAKDALLWERLFYDCFAYQIDQNLLLPQYKAPRFYIAYHYNQPVGTAILHASNTETIGVHAMGIIPEMRRKGLAEALMQHLLNQSITEGFKYASLQASAMGVGLYQKLGFKEHFRMTNYMLRQEL